MNEQTALTSWVRSLASAAVVVAAILALAVGVNIAIGRIIHWEIVTALGLGGLALFTYLNRPG